MLTSSKARPCQDPSSLSNSESEHSEHDFAMPSFQSESAPMDLGPSSLSYSLPMSLDLEGGPYTESMDGSPLLYGPSSLEQHYPLQRNSFWDPQPLLPKPSSSSSSASISHSHSHSRKRPASSISTSRSHSYASPFGRSRSRAQPSSAIARSHSVCSATSEPIDLDTTHGTLIMPTLDPPPGHSDQGQPTHNQLSAITSSTLFHHSMPRIMSPSPVPLHTRLSRIQKESKKGSRLVDLENGTSHHHLDEQDMTDSSHGYNSRRHSVVEDDVCFPLQPSNLAIDFEGLEEYLSMEGKGASLKRVPSQLEMNSSLASMGYQRRSPLGETPLLHRLTGRRSINNMPLTTPLKPSHHQHSYGSMEHRYPSLHGDRSKTQVPPLDDAYRFTLYSTASVTVHAQSLNEIPPKGQTLSEMLQAGYFWLDVLAPTGKEIRMLSQVFRVHPLTTEDILMEEGREKCEMFANYYFVCFRTLVPDPSQANSVQTSSIYTLVFPCGILTYHFRPLPHCRNVRRRIRHLKERMEVTPDWIVYAIVDEVVDTIAPLIRQVEAEVDMIDELVLLLKESEQADMLRRIGHCRKRVMSLLRLLTGKADVIKGLLKRSESKLGQQGEIGLFFGDIQDHIVTMVQNLSHYEKILSRSHSNYLAQINIEMTSASNETNNVLTKLTLLGSILLPLNLITGLWGMNVPVPGQESVGLAWFFSIVSAIFLAASLFLVLARKIKLL